MTPETLWHNVPRLDAPDKFGPLPAPVARWLAAGLFSGPVVSQLLVFGGGANPTAVWNDPALWLLWACGLLLGGVGAFVRPAGLHLGQWGSILVAYVLVPRRLVWCPVPVSRGGKHV